jgi:hypothetical protein
LRHDRASQPTGEPARRDHETISRILESCALDESGGGLTIAVCNELGNVYLAIETGGDAEFIEVMSCLAQLGFADVAPANATHDAVMRRAD